MIYPATNEYIDFAIRLLEEGEIIAYPTDTLYGLGTDATNTDAIRELNLLKGRSIPLSIVVSDLDMLKEFAVTEPSMIPELSRLLPGPYTVLLEKKDSRLSPLVTLDSPKVGIRIPNHDFPLEIVRRTGFPIITTSINRHGKAAMTDIGRIEEDFPQLTIFEDQKLRESLGSTIVDFTVTPVRIIRQGDGKYPL